jgi:hypothetical protein
VWVLFDVGDYAGVEHALAMVCEIKASIKIEIRISQVSTDLFGHLLQGLQTLWQ